MYTDDLVWSPSSIYLTQVVRHEHDLDIVEIASSIGDKFVVRAVVTNLLHKRWLNYALVGGYWSELLLIPKDQCMPATRSSVRIFIITSIPPTDLAVLICNISISHKQGGYPDRPPKPGDDGVLTSSNLQRLGSLIA